jgi:hypothetical protein
MHVPKKIAGLIFKLIFPCRKRINTSTQSANHNHHHHHHHHHHALTLRRHQSRLGGSLSRASSPHICTWPSTMLIVTAATLRIAALCVTTTMVLLACNLNTDNWFAQHKK